MDGSLTYNPNSNLLKVPNLRPTSIQQTNGATGGAGNVPVANGSGGWAWGTASAGSSIQIFSTETDTGTTSYLTFVEGNASGTKDLRHDDDLSYIPSDNRLIVDKLRLTRLEEPGGDSGSSGEVPIANGSGGWVWGTANAGGANTVLADENDNNSTRPVATLQGNDNAQNAVYYDDQFTYNHSSNELKVPRAHITELRDGTNSNGSNGHVAMSDGTNWGWEPIDLDLVEASEQTQTQSTASSSDHYLTFVNSNNGTATAENFYTDAGIRYRPSNNTLYVDRSIHLNADNNTGQGIRLSDDGDIVDLNDSYCSMRFTHGVQVHSGNGQLGTTPNTWRVRLKSDGDIWAKSNIIAYHSSDIKLKENIRVIDNPISKLLKLRGVNFDWKDDYIEERGGEDGYFTRKSDVGVIAQEVEQVLPEVVSTKEDGTKGVKYDKIVPLLIEAIKEQQATIEDLKSRLEKLEG